MERQLQFISPLITPMQAPVLAKDASRHVSYIAVRSAMSRGTFVWEMTGEWVSKCQRRAAREKHFFLAKYQNFSEAIE